MSLLTRRAPHTLMLQRRAMVRNDEGIRVPVNLGDLVEVRGMGEPVRDWASEEESRSAGLQILNMIVWRSRHWPGDVHALALYEGGWYESVGAPQHFHAGRRTAHYRVTLRWLEDA